MSEIKKDGIPTSTSKGRMWSWGHHGDQGWWGSDTTKCGWAVWKKNATKRALDMFGSPHLTIGYLISGYEGDE